MYPKNLKKVALFLLVFISVVKGNAQYAPVNVGSSVQFKIKNFGIDVGGSLTGLQGVIKFDINKPAESNFDVSIDATTVNTKNELRDNHLKNETYFDVRKYPRIHFVSDKVTPDAKKGTFLVSGNLTIKNQTKNISFRFTATTIDNGYLFKGGFMINRRYFGIGGMSIISDKLEVLLNVLAKK